MEKIPNSLEGPYICRQEPILRKDGSFAIEEITESPRSGSHVRDIIWRSSDDKEVSFNKFLPGQKYRFVKMPPGPYEYAALFKDKVITYGDLALPMALLSLLHEIGHAHIYETAQEKKYQLASSAYEEYINDLNNRQLTEEDIKKRGENPKDYVYVTEFDPKGKEGKEFVEEPDNQFFQMLVPRKLAEDFGQTHAQNERDAWAYALKTLRKLKQEGLDLEPGLKLEDFLNKIYSYLETYEKYHKRRGVKEKYFTKNKKFKRIELI